MSRLDIYVPGWRKHPIKSLQDEAMHGEVDIFGELAHNVIKKGQEHLYQMLAEVAASGGNLPIIEYIEGIYILDYDPIVTMARTYGHYELAADISGYETVPIQRDLPTTEDLEEDRDNLTEDWQNMGGFTIIKTDSPVEEEEGKVDTTPRYKLSGTRRWGWNMDDADLEVTSTTMEWMDSP